MYTEKNYQINRKRTLLIIEDNEINRDILCELVADDYDTLIACNGKEGLDILEQHSKEISLILLDVNMPVMDGYEFLRVVRNNPLFNRIPVIVTTASERVEEEEICLDLGANDFVAKPYNPNIVLRRIRSMISLRESAATLEEVEFDDLTGVFTRPAFYHHARVLLENNPDVDYTLIISDIEDLKVINANYGEKAGDELIKQNAAILPTYTPSTGIYGRYGGDQFVMLVPSLKDDNKIRQAAKYMQTLVDSRGRSHVIKFGIYENVDHNQPISVLCDRAIAALNTVKHQYGQYFGVYNRKLQDRLNLIFLMEQAMEESLVRDYFKVYYQPKHDAKTGELVGAEALIRWIHPEFGFMNPGEFIPLFERNGFICTLDYYVLERTCMNLRKWIDQGISVVPVSINGSKLDFAQPNFFEIVQRITKSYDISPELLHIEVTESLFADHQEELSSLLKKCRDAGYKIELDDFGSGYSSLSLLASLPLDAVKLDMLFMKNLHNLNNHRVLSSIINLGKNLGLQTISEGVETEEQIQVIQQLGGDVIQGYAYSKPLPENEFLEYLKKYKR